MLYNILPKGGIAMQRLEEKLESIVKELNGANVKVLFENYIIGEIIFENIDIKYDRNIGYIKLVSNEKRLELNVSDINYLDNDKEIEIGFDNSQKLKILKK